MGSQLDFQNFVDTIHFMKRKPGRPARDPEGIASKLFPIRLTDTEKSEYERAAVRAGVSVSEWIRERLNRAAKREAKIA